MKSVDATCNLHTRVLSMRQRLNFVTCRMSLFLVNDCSTRKLAEDEIGKCDCKHLNGCTVTLFGRELIEPYACTCERIIA